MCGFDLFTLRLSFQVHELVDGNAIPVIDEVERTMVSVHNFLLAESDVLKVL